MTLSSLPLSYCSNVHPACTIAEVLAGIEDVSAPAGRSVPFPIAAGLWLPASVIDELRTTPGRINEIAQALWQNELCCYTLNTFPYGNFHSERVKEQVYLPDWSDARRLEYTLGCAATLAELLPDAGIGSLSTLPLGGRMNPVGADFEARCFRHLIQTARALRELQQSTGRTIRLAVEPEPMCYLSGTRTWTLPIMARFFQFAESQGCDDIAREFIGLCLDVCHQAVEFEDLHETVRLFVDAGIRINKVHITNAIELRHPASNHEGREALARFVEPRYLHQTSARFSDGTVSWHLDLNRDLTQLRGDDDFIRADAWRVHFHVPIFAEALGPLHTTRAELTAALSAIAQLDYAPHLEVETYTWPVMPGESPQETLTDRIARELVSAGDVLAAVD